MTRTPGLAAFIAGAVAVGMFVSAGDLAARPPIRKAFFNAYPSVVGSRLDNLPSHSTHCGVCHYDFNGGGPRNPFGIAVGNALGTTASTEQDILSIQNLDSDGDGRTNLEEITDLVHFSNTPTFPGLTSGNVGSTSNVPNLGEITPYLTPAAGADGTPPAVTVTSPDGGQSWTGGTGHAITWSASDNVAVVAVDLYFRDAEAADWKPLAKGLSNSSSFTWFVPNMPTAAARVRAVARDAAGNEGADASDAVFTIVQTPGGIVHTTLRDFEQPGTQPLGGGSFQAPSACTNCHGGYDTAVEPGHQFLGMMMGQAARDPLFFAALAIAEQDAPSAGDLCIRCHSPIGWLSGRSQPTDASQLTSLDREGLACDVCHRAVNPIYQAGVSPAEDVDILAALQPSHVPTGYSNGQLVVDPEPNRRGPFADATTAPHPFLESAFHRSSEFCGTCHDVSNPVFDRVSGPDYAPGPLDQAAATVASHVNMPLERTYSEWKNSDYPSGVYAPQFAGNKPDGVVSTCQDCHMRDVEGAGCNDPLAPTRSNLPFHDLMGGNAWMGPIIADLYPAQTDAAALDDGSVRAVSMLEKAASVDVSVESVADSFRALVTVTNHTGHKLPTGYPEGRRMWLHVVARDALDQIVYESGAYDAASGVLTHDADAVVYEIELGISQPLANAVGLPAAAGPSFHFALNDTVYKDNRIPPLGFTNAAFEAFGGGHADPTRPVPRYADGQNWDVSAYPLPPTARSVRATLHYQTTSKEFVEFLESANTTTTDGDAMLAVWEGNGRSAPVAMADDSVAFVPTGVNAGPVTAFALRPLANPFRGTLALSLTLPRDAAVTLDVFDARGRRVSRQAWTQLARGVHVLRWDGRDGGGRAMAAGAYWARVEADGVRLVRQVVLLR